MSNPLQIILILCLCLLTIGNSYGQSTPTPNQLLAACQSMDAMTIFRNTQKLQAFPKAAFDKSASQSLAKLVVAKAPHQDKLILLSGFLGDKETIVDLLAEEKITKQNKQVVKLALVRMGDEAKLNNLMKNVQKIPIGDEFVFEVLPMLIYARQKEVTDYLLEIVLSDEKKCTPADAETSGNINCAYRIIEALAPILNDFPYEVDSFGDLITTDYNKVLPKVRKWIAKNKSNYSLNTDIY